MKLWPIILLVTAYSTTGLAKDTAECAFKDPKKLEEHLNKHVTYPITGKDLKQVCKKEWPDEFSKAENDCADKHLKDGDKYSSAAEVKKALGIK